MLTEERQNYILQCLQTQPIIKLHDLVAHTHASESTVRRDLQELEDGGLLTRIHGGAKRLASLLEEPSQTAKANTNLQEKRRIAQYAADKLKQNAIVFLDAGTTIQAMIPYLKSELHLTIVTNGVDTASMLSETNLKILLIGGQIKNLTKAVIGSKAMEQIHDYQFDIAFLGTNGIHGDFGFSTPDPEEGALKRAIISRSAENYILADASKFGRVSFDRFAKLDAVQVITSRVPAEYRSILQQTKIEEVSSK